MATRRNRRSNHRRKLRKSRKNNKKYKNRGGTDPSIITSVEHTNVIPRKIADMLQQSLSSVSRLNVPNNFSYFNKTKKSYESDDLVIIGKLNNYINDARII